MQHETALHLAAHADHRVTAPREIVRQQRRRRVVCDEVPNPVGLAVLGPCHSRKLDAKRVVLGGWRVHGWAVPNSGIGITAAPQKGRNLVRDTRALGRVGPYKMMRRRRFAKPGHESLVCMIVDIASGAGSLVYWSRMNARFHLSGKCTRNRRIDREGSRMQGGRN